MGAFKASRRERRMDVWADMSVKELIGQFGGAGYAGKRMAEAISVYKKMIDDEKCIKFLTAAGQLIAGGMRNVLVEFIRAGAVDVFVTTGAILSHDLIESFGVHHYQGTSNVDDRELAKKEIFRIYDIFLAKEAFMKLEDGLKKLFPKLPQEEMSPRQFLKELGKQITDKGSILKACADMDVSIYCPAITDSMLGFHAWVYSQTKELKINPQLDIKDFMDIVWGENKTYGMLILGGGVPKHFVPGMMQASGNALSYVIQITMDRPEHGGVSGMQIVEAKSWGKAAPEAYTCDMRCDVTLAFPILVADVLSYLKEKDGKN